MAGGDHHAAVTVAVQHGEGKGRRGHKLAVKVDLDAARCHDAGGFPGKQLAFMAAVVGNGDRRGGVLRKQVVGEALGGLPDGIQVHAVGAGAQLAAQTAGAKLQRPVKPLVDLFFLIADRQQLSGQFGVGDLLQPAAQFHLFVAHLLRLLSGPFSASMIVQKEGDCQCRTAARG